MTLLALLVLGTAASALSAWALARGGTAARLGAVGGILTLVLVAVLAAASPTPESLTPDETGAVAGTLWNGALVPGAYFRIVIVLWAGSSVLVAGAAWLLRGTAGLRGILPAMLAGLVGGAVALAAATPTLAIVAAAATGLASVPVVLATPRAVAAGVAAREVRIAVATAMVVLVVAAVAPVVSRLVLANPDGPASAPDSGASAAVAVGLLAVATVVAGRVGAIPFHVRVIALSDVAPTGSLPLLAAWLPLPLAVVAVDVTAGVLAPMALPVGPSQTFVMTLTLAATLAAVLVAWLQDDLRHAVGYLTAADLGLVILALASLDPTAWGPARTWLLTVALTKSALFVWAAVTEDRFQTRSVPDLRGWLRPAPVLGLGLVLIVLATYGLPGWAVLHARRDLVGLAAGAPWGLILLAASFLSLPTYLRWLWVGIGAPTSHVDRAAPEAGWLQLARLPRGRLSVRPPTRGREASLTLPVEQERSAPDPAPGSTAAGEPGSGPGSSAALPDGDGGARDPDVRPSTGVSARGRTRTRGTSQLVAASAPTTVAAAAAPGTDDLPAGAEPRRGRRVASGATIGQRAGDAIRRHRAGLLSTAVLALALLASLVASGAFGIERAAGEPGPAVAGVSDVGN